MAIDYNSDLYGSADGTEYDPTDPLGLKKKKPVQAGQPDAPKPQGADATAQAVPTDNTPQVPQAPAPPPPPPPLPPPPPVPAAPPPAPTATPVPTTGPVATRTSDPLGGYYYRPTTGGPAKEVSGDEWNKLKAQDTANTGTFLGTRGVDPSSGQKYSLENDRWYDPSLGLPASEWVNSPIAAAGASQAAPPSTGPTPTQNPTGGPVLTPGALPPPPVPPSAPSAPAAPAGPPGQVSAQGQDQNARLAALAPLFAQIFGNLPQMPQIGNGQDSAAGQVSGIDPNADLIGQSILPGQDPVASRLRDASLQALDQSNAFDRTKSLTGALDALGTPAEQARATRLSDTAESTVNGMPDRSALTSSLRDSLLKSLTPSGDRLNSYNSLLDTAAGGMANVDRMALAKQALGDFKTNRDAQFEFDRRKVLGNNAALGRIGSGYLNTDYGNLELARERDYNTFENQLIRDATEGSINDQFNKVNALSGLQSNAYSQDYQPRSLAAQLAESGANSDIANRFQKADSLAGLSRDARGAVSNNLGVANSLVSGQASDLNNRLTSTNSMLDKTLAENRAQRDEARGERGYQVGLDNQAYQRQVDQYNAEQQANQRAVDNALNLGTFAYGGNPSGALSQAGQSDTMSQLMPLIMALSQNKTVNAGGGGGGGQTGGAGDTNSLDAILAALARQIPGVQTTPSRP